MARECVCEGERNRVRMEISVMGRDTKRDGGRAVKKERERHRERKGVGE